MAGHSKSYRKDCVHACMSVVYDLRGIAIHACMSVVYDLRGLYMHV